MSQFIVGNTRTYAAGGSINANKVVRLGASDNTVHHNTSSTTPNTGTSMHSASSGENVTVQLDGTAKLVANAQLTRNAVVKADTNGGIRTTTTGNDSVVGVVLESTTQTVTESGTEVVEVDLSCRNSRY